jgi:flagellin-like hook-associated protein FlgL
LPKVTSPWRRGISIVTVDEEKLARGDNLIFLESAYRIARTLIAAKASEEEKSEIDTGFINAEVENITTAMKNVSDIYTKAGTIRNSADAIEKTLNKFLDKVQDHLDNIRSHLPC